MRFVVDHRFLLSAICIPSNESRNTDFRPIASCQRVLFTTRTTGDVACFDNIRVLHGREAFAVQSSEERLLEGSYLDWDEMRSRRRVLETK